MFFLSQKQRDEMKEELKYAKYDSQRILIIEKWREISEQQKKYISKQQ
jgi:hypothetical protein